MARKNKLQPEDLYERVSALNRSGFHIYGCGNFDITTQEFVELIEAFLGEDYEEKMKDLYERWVKRLD